MASWTAFWKLFELKKLAIEYFTIFWISDSEEMPVWADDEAVGKIGCWVDCEKSSLFFHANSSSSADLVSSGSFFKPSTLIRNLEIPNSFAISSLLAVASGSDVSRMSIYLVEMLIKRDFHPFPAWACAFFLCTEMPKLIFFVDQQTKKIFLQNFA